MEGAAMPGGGCRAALAWLFPLTLSRKLQRKPWEERKGSFNGGTVQLRGKEARLVEGQSLWSGGVRGVARQWQLSAEARCSP